MVTVASIPEEDCFVNKEIASADEAVSDITDGATVMLGGFGLCESPRL